MEALGDYSTSFRIHNHLDVGLNLNLEEIIDGFWTSKPNGGNIAAQSSTDRWVLKDKIGTSASFFTALCWSLSRHCPPIVGLVGTEVKLTFRGQSDKEVILIDVHVRCGTVLNNTATISSKEDLVFHTSPYEGGGHPLYGKWFPVFVCSYALLTAIGISSRVRHQSSRLMKKLPLSAWQDYRTGAPSEERECYKAGCRYTRMYMYAGCSDNVESFDRLCELGKSTAATEGWRSSRGAVAHPLAGHKSSVDAFSNYDSPDRPKSPAWLPVSDKSPQRWEIGRKLAGQPISASTLGPVCSELRCACAISIREQRSDVRTVTCADREL